MDVVKMSRDLHSISKALIVAADKANAVATELRGGAFGDVTADGGRVDEEPSVPQRYLDYYSVAGEASFSLYDVAAAVKCSHNTAVKYLELSVDAGLISIESRSGRGGRGRKTQYRRRKPVVEAVPEAPEPLSPIYDAAAHRPSTGSAKTFGVVVRSAIYSSTVGVEHQPFGNADAHWTRVGARRRQYLETLCGIKIGIYQEVLQNSYGDSRKCIMCETLRLRIMMAAGWKLTSPAAIYAESVTLTVAEKEMVRIEAGRPRGWVEG